MVKILAMVKILVKEQKKNAILEFNLLINII